MDDERTLRPDFWVVVFDETRYWNLGEYEKYIAKVEGVYYFDRNEQTYLCEITPSYLLYPIGSRPVLVDGLFQEDGILMDKIYTYIMDGDVELNEIYWHCSDLELTMPEIPHRKLGDYFPDVSLDEYEEMVESMREYLQGNEVV